jgi:hypothetical protein
MMVIEAVDATKCHGNVLEIDDLLGVCYCFCKKMRPSSRVDGAHSDGIWAAAWNGDVIYTAALDGIASAWYIY